MISLNLVNWNISDSTYSSCHICHFILLDLGTEYCRAHTCVLYILCIFLLPWYMTMYTKMAFKKTRMLFETELFIVNYDIVIRFSYIRTIFMSIWNHFRDLIDIHAIFNHIIWAYSKTEMYEIICVLTNDNRNWPRKKKKLSHSYPLFCMFYLSDQEHNKIL